MKKYNATQKALIRKTWKAWARYAHLCWDIAAGYEEGTRTSKELYDLCREDRECYAALSEWYVLNDLCEELKIEFVTATEIDEETKKASEEHDMYNEMFWKHCLR